MLIIAGLGNPGSEYAGTRHNIGFDIIDFAAAQLGCRFRPGNGEYHAAEGTLERRAFLLVKPQTYMNNSGVALADLLRTSGSKTEELMVISDDFHLPFGALRLRLKGSGGGHNGLASIIEELGSNMFPRLRCGIAGATMPPTGRDRRDYVLRQFERQERAAISEILERAYKFLTLIIAEGPATAQQRFHNIR